MERIYENYFELEPVVEENMSFKRFLSWSSGGPPIWWSGTIYELELFFYEKTDVSPLLMSKHESLNIISNRNIKYNV